MALQSKSNVQRAIATLVGGTVASQVLTLLAMPLLARLFAPEEFGVAALFGAIVGTALVASCLRYEQALPLPKTNIAACNVAALCVVILLVSTTVLSLVVLLWGHQLGLPSTITTAYFAALLAIGMLAGGGYMIGSQWAIRRRAFKDYAATRVWQTLYMLGVQIFGGLAGLGTIALIAGQIIGQSAGTFRLGKPMLSFWPSVTPLRVRWAISRFRSFARYDTFAGLLNVASAQAPIVVISALFTAEMAGFYALAYRVVSAPNGVVGRALAQVLLPMTAAQDELSRRKTTLRALRYLSAISLVPFSLAALAADLLVPLAFGSQWAGATDIFYWTAIVAGWQLICSPISVLLITGERQGLNSALQLIIFLARVGGLAAGYALGSAPIAIAAFSIASVLTYCLYIVAVALAVRITLLEVFKILAIPSTIALVALLAAGSIRQYDPLSLVVMSVVLIAWLLHLAWIFVSPSGDDMRK